MTWDVSREIVFEDPVAGPRDPKRRSRWEQSRVEPGAVNARPAYLRECAKCGMARRHEPMSPEASQDIDRRRAMGEMVDVWFVHDCMNPECAAGPIAKELKRRIRRDPCPACKGSGVVMGRYGDCDVLAEMICDEDGCESARLLERDLEAPFSWLSPSDPF